MTLGKGNIRRMVVFAILLTAGFCILKSSCFRRKVAAFFKGSTFDGFKISVSANIGKVTASSDTRYVFNGNALIQKCGNFGDGSLAHSVGQKVCL